MHKTVFTYATLVHFFSSINYNSHANSDSDREFLTHWIIPLYSFKMVFLIKSVSVRVISKMDVLDTLNKLDFTFTLISLLG